MAMNAMKEQGYDIENLSLDELPDIKDLTPDIEKTVDEKVKTFMDKTKQQPFAHINEGYVVVVKTTGELEATDVIQDYLRKRVELLY